MDVNPSTIWAVLNLKHEGGVMVSSPMKPIPVRLMLCGHPVDSPEEDTTKTASKNDKVHWDNCVTEFPWLANLDSKFMF